MKSQNCKTRLEDKLNIINRGFPSDENCIAPLIQEAADISLQEYFSGYPFELEQLVIILQTADPNISTDFRTMPYIQVAAFVHNNATLLDTGHLMEALMYLAMPIYNAIERRHDK